MIRSPIHLVASIAAVAVAVAGGCGSAIKPAATAEPTSRSSVAPIISPAVLAEPDGLEIRQWTVRFDPDALAAALAPYLEAPPITDAVTEQRLRETGLRLVVAPIEAVESLRARMPLTGRIDRRWVGQAPDWTEIYAGERFAAGTPVRVGDERLILGEGQLRMLLRTWTELDTEPRLRIDIAVQHEPPRGPMTLSTAVAPRRRGVVEEGLIFRSSVAELILDGSSVALLIPASPEEDWFHTEAEPEDAGDDSPVADDSPEPAAWLPQPEAPAEFLSGPPAPNTPTLGEALMLTTDRAAAAPRSRAVIVLIPRVAGRAGILP